MITMRATAAFTAFLTLATLITPAKRRATAVALLLLLCPAVVWALTGEALESRLREITNQLRCPTCQAISVKDSGASFSRQIVDKVRRMLQEGQSEEQIKAFFVSRYGEWILRAPKKEGLGLVLWVLPGLAILVAGVWIIFKVQRGVTADRATRGETAEVQLGEKEKTRIEHDLRRFEEEF